MQKAPVNENRYIPAFFLSSAITAAISPYLAILLRDLGYSTIMVGIFLGIFEGAGIAGPLAFGYLADKSNKYRLLLVICCMVVALTAFPLALLINPLGSVLLLVLMAFCFKATISLLDAATTIQIGTTGNYGKIRVWGSIGYVAAMFYLQWTPFFKPVNAVHIAFWITALSLAAVIPIFIMPKTSGRVSISEGKPPEFHLGKKIISVYFVIGFLLIFLSRFAMTSFYTYFPLYLTEVVQWNAVGLIFGLSAASEIPFVFFSNRIIRRFGPLPLLALSATAVCVRLLLLSVFPYKMVFIFAQLLHSLCYGIFHPAAIEFFSRVFPPEKRGLGMSIYLALGTGLPTLISNMAGGVIVETQGYRPLLAIYAAVSGIAVLVYFGLCKKTVKVDN